MKAHLWLAEKCQIACQVYVRCLKGDYEILPLDRFKQVYKKDKKYCCKKCLGYLEKIKEELLNDSIF